MFPVADDGATHDLNEVTEMREGKIKIWSNWEVQL